MPELAKSSASSLAGCVVIITGGAGLLGREHARAVMNAGGIPVIWDIDGNAAQAAAAELLPHAVGLAVDVTDPGSVASALDAVLKQFGAVSALINNAARNPAVGRHLSQLVALDLADRVASWRVDLEIGLLGSYICSEIVGESMASSGGGAIVNIASDLSVISPDQRLYVTDGDDGDSQVGLKPASYSVVKTGLIGLTRWHATYFAESNIHVNALSPGGVRTDQDPKFVQRLTSLIPMGRMASHDEYHGAVVFLCSEASRYMTGQNMVIDGGRSVW